MVRKDYECLKNCCTNNFEYEEIDIDIVSNDRKVPGMRLFLILDVDKVKQIQDDDMLITILKLDSGAEIELKQRNYEFAKTAEQRRQDKLLWRTND